MTTSAPSPPGDCPQMELALTQSAAASPVRTSASPERGRALRVSAPVYGVNMLASFASFDPASSSWRTSQLSLVADLETYSETWPRSGTMLGGIAYRLPPLAPLTAATGSGLLPTPEASNTKASAMRSGGRSPRNFLLPTPRATDGSKGMRSLAGAQAELDRGRNLDLGMIVRLWPTPDQSLWATPTAHPRTHTPRKVDHGEQLANQVGGSLNPTWVELLMGFPAGWTKVMETMKPIK